MSAQIARSRITASARSKRRCCDPCPTMLTCRPRPPRMHPVAFDGLDTCWRSHRFGSRGLSAPRVGGRRESTERRPPQPLGLRRSGIQLPATCEGKCPEYPGPFQHIVGVVQILGVELTKLRRREWLVVWGICPAGLLPIVGPPIKHRAYSAVQRVSLVAATAWRSARSSQLDARCACVGLLLAHALASAERKLLI